MTFSNVTLVATGRGPPTVLECPHTVTHTHVLAQAGTWCVCAFKLEGKHAISAVKGGSIATWGQSS